MSYNIDCDDQGNDNNMTGTKHALPTVSQAIGLNHLGSNAQMVDTLTVEELNSTTLSNFVTQLNATYGAGTYTYDTTQDPNTGGWPDGLIYNTHTLQVISARALPTGQNVLLQPNGTYTMAHSPGGGVNGVTCGPMLYQLRPIGAGTTNDFYLCVSHARSTSDDSVGDARYAEAQEVRVRQGHRDPVPVAPERRPYSSCGVAGGRERAAIGTWRSSLSRTDTGNGACERVWVEEVEQLAR
ncbi:MAG: hypothetical protein ACR2II_02555 [Chthoniobacterales bacterium]